MYQINPAQTAEQNLIAMINSGSTVVFTGTEYDVGPPTAQTPEEPSEDTNTTFLMTAREGSGYMDSISPRYKRLTVGDTRPGAFQEWLVTSAKTRESLIDDILENHKLLASEVTFTGLEDGMPAAGQTGELTVTANEGSYFYIGEFDFSVVNTDPA